jgi:hypothetical protein
MYLYLFVAQVIGGGRDEELRVLAYKIVAIISLFFGLMLNFHRLLLNWLAVEKPNTNEWRLTIGLILIFFFYWRLKVVFI